MGSFTFANVNDRAATAGNTRYTDDVIYNVDLVTVLS